MEREEKENYWKEVFDQVTCQGVMGKDKLEIIPKHTHVDIISMEMLFTFSNIPPESENENEKIVDEEGNYIKKSYEKVQEIGLQYNRYDTYEMWHISSDDVRTEIFNNTKGLFKKGKKKYIESTKHIIIKSDTEYFIIKHYMPFTEKDYDHPFFELIVENYIPYERTRCEIGFSMHLPERLMPIIGTQLVNQHLRLIKYNVITD